MVSTPDSGVRLNQGRDESCVVRSARTAAKRGPDAPQRRFAGRRPAACGLLASCQRDEARPEAARRRLMATTTPRGLRTWETSSVSSGGAAGGCSWSSGACGGWPSFQPFKRRSAGHSPSWRISSFPLPHGLPACALGLDVCNRRAASGAIEKLVQPIQQGLLESSARGEISHYGDLPEGGSCCADDAADECGLCDQSQVERGGDLGISHLVTLIRVLETTATCGVE